MEREKEGENDDFKWVLRVYAYSGRSPPDAALQ